MFTLKQIILTLIISILSGISVFSQNIQINTHQERYGISSIDFEPSDPAVSQSVENAILQPCVINTIPAYTNDGLSIAQDGDDFWIGSFPSQILKVSSTTGALLKTLNIGFTRPYGIVLIDGYLWVTDNIGSSIHKIDTTSGATVKSFPTPFSNDEAGLAWDGKLLWHVSLGGQNITKIDTATGLAVDTLDVSFLTWPSGITFQGPCIWLGENTMHEIHLIDTATLNILATVKSPTTFPNGYVYDGQDLWMITNPFGADSIFHIDLTCTLCDSIPLSSFISASVCDSFISPSGNTVYTQTGIYYDTLATHFGCDSIITIDLVVNQPVLASISPSVCDSYTSPSGNNIWTTSGTYLDTLVSVNGCDSILTINLVVVNVDAGVSQNNATLTANASGITYQWVDCDLSWAVIPNETNQAFVPTINGNYAVIVTKNGCIDTSACTSINTVGINKNVFGTNIEVYPNPNQGEFQINLGKPISNFQITIRTIEGKFIKTQNASNQQSIKIELPEIAGIYLVELKLPKNQAVIKVLRQ